MESTNQATFESYDAMDIAIPMGPINVPMADSRTVQCQPLPFKRAVHWLRMLDRAQLGDNAAFLRICDEFPTEVGLDDVEVTVPEMFDLLRRFCLCRRREPSGMKEDQAPVTPTSDSMT